jgi:hypothetical protein
LDADGRAGRLREVVVDTVDDASLDQAMADLRAGSGGELNATTAHRPKFHSAFSSCALVVNVFGLWRLEPRDLALNGESDFTTLRFESQRPIFKARATPPNLDVILEADDRVAAIESKLTEHLSGNEQPSFSVRYEDAVQELADPSWSAVFALLQERPSHFRFLNAHQLFKHYLGLKRAQQDDPRPVTLNYLYWEPANAERIDTVMQHRLETEELAERLDDPEVQFSALSYPELWATWEQSTKDSRLSEHINRLRVRYAVEISR